MLGSSDTPGPEFCPRIEIKKTNSTEILIASGSEKRLLVRAVHLQVAVVFHSTASIRARVFVEFGDQLVGDGRRYSPKDAGIKDCVLGGKHYTAPRPRLMDLIRFRVLLNVDCNGNKKRNRVSVRLPCSALHLPCIIRLISVRRSFR